MARKDRHYEAAFQDYLRSRGIPYCSVNESQRAIFSGEKIKSFDFLVYPGGPRHWIVDVKGRKFPYVTATGGKRYWENWVSQADLDGLAEWGGVFGEDFEPCFVFAYLLTDRPDRWPAVRPHVFNDAQYAFLTVSLADYHQHCRPRSAKWDTLSVPASVFRDIVRPIEPVAG